MAWVLVERESFVRMCEKVGITKEVLEAILRWAPTVPRCMTPRLKLIYRSPHNRYEAWAAGIPNPDSNRGKSGGYRVVYFIDLVDGNLNLDFIEERKELGFKGEGNLKKNRYSSYIDELKKYLKKLDP